MSEDVITSLEARSQRVLDQVLKALNGFDSPAILMVASCLVAETVALMADTRAAAQIDLEMIKANIEAVIARDWDRTRATRAAIKVRP